MIKSVSKKMFLTTSLVLMAIILFLVSINGFVLKEAFYSENGSIGIYGVCIIIFTTLVGSLIFFLIVRSYTKPIEDLEEIAERELLNLIFSKKYKVRGTGDEIDKLGISINKLSQEFEDSLKKMRKINNELEKDIENKSKIDEMRKQFISDVSHELKTPISLIQGYAEGLIENVNTDEENKNFYSEVILDEANKMDITC